MALQPLPFTAFLNTDPSIFQNLVCMYDFTGNVNDTSGLNNTATIQGTLTPTTDRKGNANAAYSFNGTNGWISTSALLISPQDYSINVWFNTSLSTGGTLVGFADSATSLSPADHDRMLWMDTSGRLVYGVYPNSVVTITSPGSYNDGLWHMATAVTSSTTGMALYVDTVQVATNPNTASQAYNGYWRIGNDSLTGWGTVPGNFFAGTLDDVKIYRIALNQSQISNLYLI